LVSGISETLSMNKEGKKRYIPEESSSAKSIGIDIKTSNQTKGLSGIQ